MPRSLNPGESGKSIFTLSIVGTTTVSTPLRLTDTLPSYTYTLDLYRS